MSFLTLFQPTNAFSRNEMNPYSHRLRLRRNYRDPFRDFDDAFDALARGFPRPRGDNFLNLRDEDDEFLAETPGFGQRHDESADDNMPRSYGYSMSSSSVTVDGETRTTVRRQYQDSDGGSKFHESRVLRDRDERYFKEFKTQDLGQEEVKVTYQGAEDAATFADAWAPKLALTSEEEAVGTARRPNTDAS